MRQPPLWSLRYSVATDVLGAIIEMVHDGSLADAVDTYVTGPPGMDDSSFVVGDPERLAVPYADGDPRAVRMAEPHRVDDLVFSPARAFDERFFQSGGGGMVGTAGDFARSLEAWRLGGAPILSPDTVDEASRNQVGGLRDRDEPGWGFGFISGVLLDPQRAGGVTLGGRAGRVAAYGAVLLAAYDPDADLFRTVGKCGTFTPRVACPPALPRRWRRCRPGGWISCHGDDA